MRKFNNILSRALIWGLIFGCLLEHAVIAGPIVNKLVGNLILKSDVKKILEDIDDWIVTGRQEIELIAMEGNGYFIGMGHPTASDTLADRLRDLGIDAKSDSGRNGWGVILSDAQLRTLHDKIKPAPSAPVLPPRHRKPQPLPTQAPPAQSTLTQSMVAADKVTFVQNKLKQNNYDSIIINIPPLPGSQNFSYFVGLNSEQIARNFSDYLATKGIIGSKGNKAVGKFATGVDKFGVLLSQANLEKLYNDFSIPQIPKRDIEPAFRSPAQPPKPQKAIIFQSPLELYNTLDPMSNEAVLIQRAAFYMTNKGKQSEFNQASPTQKANSVAQVLNSRSYIDNFNMFNKMLPVHRLNKDAMMGVYNLGYFISTKIIVIGKEKQFNDETFVPLIELMSTIKPNPNLKFIAELAAVKFALEAYPLDPSENFAVNFNEPSQCSKLADNDVPGWQTCSAALNKLVEKNTMNESLQSDIMNILKIKAGGINYFIDKYMETDGYVFSLLGINHGTGYGHIYVPIKPEIFTKAWSTPVAATFFIKNPTNPSGRAQYGAEVGRVWVTPEQAWIPEGKKAFKASQVRGPREVLALVAAAEMMGRVLAYFVDNVDLKPEAKKSLEAPMKKLLVVKTYEQISPEHVRTYMENVDSHDLWEVHVEPFPISYIQNVIMSKAIYDSGFDKLVLSPEQKAKLIIKDLPNPQMQAVSEAISAPQ